MADTWLGLAKVREVMDRALTSEKGIKVRFRSARALHSFRSRCYRARQLDRESNRLAFETEHVLHNKSEWDVLGFSTEGPKILIITRAIGDLPPGVEGIEDL